MCDDEVQITRAKPKPEIQKRKKQAVREAYFLFGAAFVRAGLNKSAVFYMSAERPPALGDV